ncbi:aromatic-ring-hydroxylating dioxygenase subunit beta [Alicyclobacillus dauci]|uniref:Aromatic-ring-hydroxylating dioxygenase subunit beta n=1 Tax=Alicyclobacillus dauci TaxID=1475485 RepID=A0ABY6Z740_9BACL|nr:aromatic-ring-hydroxylating dioxygenase subunit beta [Alicyclobacillus dauci]WAH37991.1 aromatic-ring-hydroxylating dioxygenase subunit beta [Alicyclobacillus dauci]
MTEKQVLNRAVVEDFLYEEASLLDEWRLDEWLEMLTDDASYYVPPNDAPDADHHDTLFIVADDIHRIKSRVKRLKSRHAHAENPKSKTRRMISNVRIRSVVENVAHVTANFVVYRFRRHEQIREYVGRYEYKLAIDGTQLRIAERKAILDSEELARLGSVSIIL